MAKLWKFGLTFTRVAMKEIDRLPTLPENLFVPDD